MGLFVVEQNKVTKWNLYVTLSTQVFHHIDDYCVEGLKIEIIAVLKRDNIS